jgi:Peptidase propeptide and YPEB domain
MGRDSNQEERIMWNRSISRTILCLALLGVITPADALTQQELVAKLEAAGYTQVSDIKSSAEGTAVKAMKNGKEVRLVVDSRGQIKEQN